MRILASTSLVFTLALLSSGPAFTQSTPVDDIYVQTAKGVNVYAANASGQLTLVPGSPFAVTGQMEAVRGSSFLISVGTNLVHVYKLNSNGGVGAQVSQIDTASYGGNECGNTSNGGSILDHTGQYFSLQLGAATTSSNPETSCIAWQTYKLGTDGQFTFLGDSESTFGDHQGAYPVGISTYSSNDAFAYGAFETEYAGQFSAYKRAAAGDLIVNSSFTEKDPTPNPTDGDYAPVYVAADAASHLAAIMNMPFGPACCSTFQLASYTINNSTGAIQSTNTYSNMPTLQIYPISIGMSWTGNFVAAGGSPGLQVFHFNGASPATADGGVLLPSVEIDKVAWDKNNHLFALSDEEGELYVYAVTTTGITAGSSYALSDAYGLNTLIVVPK